MVWNVYQETGVHIVRNKNNFEIIPEQTKKKDKIFNNVPPTLVYVHGILMMYSDQSRKKASQYFIRWLLGYHS